MKKILQIISFMGLCLTVIPSFLVLAGRIPWSVHSACMLTGMLLWFATAPFWMRKDN